MRLKDIKQKYNKSPNDWIVVTRRYDCLECSWFKSVEPINWSSTFDFKLIHVKHKQVLEAYLEDNSVEVKVKPNWTIPNFIETYNAFVEYRLKEKEDGN